MAGNNPVAGGGMRRPSQTNFLYFIIVFSQIFLLRPVQGQDLSASVSDRITPGGERAAMRRLADTGISLEETLISFSSEAGEELTGRAFDPVSVDREIRRLETGARAAVGERKDPRAIVAALNRYLFEEQGFAYDCAAGVPENFLLDHVLSRKRGNCLGLSSLYLILAERLDLPLRGVYLPSHCFVRYDDGTVRFNIETREKGEDYPDGRYWREFGLSEGRPYLASLTKKEMAGVYLKSVGAAFSRNGMDERALRLSLDASAYYPGYPDAWFNAGVSCLKTGRLEEAVSMFRRALRLDPRMAAAQDNLGVALARQGRFREALEEARKAVELSPRSTISRGNLAATLCACGEVDEGMREYRRVLEIDPGNARALSALAKAHFARGEYQEAIFHSDRATALGCAFDPAMLDALEKQRTVSATDLP